MTRPLPLLACLLVCCLVSGLAAAKPKDGKAAPAEPVDYRSDHFYLHTDLPPSDAQELLERLETMLELISTYWARPCLGIIECYVVADLAHWPTGMIPEEGLAHIKAGAGVTSVTTLSSGGQSLSRSVVYSVADRGTPQHEAVHAYCGQTFGTTGPVWYSEGMAEMGQYWRKDDTSVQIHEGVLDYLRSSTPKSIDEIVHAEEFTGDSWQNYAWRWALCHLLAYNTNYASRFRPLGLAFLKKEPTSFEEAYGDMTREIEFEYHFFLSHLDQGFRNDLCSWDWQRKFRAPKGSAALTSKIKADHGWQPSGAIVAAGADYQCKATGSWQTAKDAQPRSADGVERELRNRDHQTGGETDNDPDEANEGEKGDAIDDADGRLMGVVLSDDDENYRLSEPFELGGDATFTAPADGKLYLRCRDSWGKLADNKGTLTVKIKAKRNASRARE
ncbi:MAG TPA: hypothetical protein VFW87_18585 [Pirellulales bacterium]|nr:hypothetical protein [Pirellulales bacterium]